MANHYWPSPLVRDEPSGVYFARVRVQGKLIRRSLNTTVLAVAKLRLGDFENCADLVQFLAFGGFRLGEARHITWADCDFAKAEITVRGEAETGTKNSEIRTLRMIPDMTNLLQRLRHERPQEAPTANVMQVKECQKAMDRAAKRVDMEQITHHDLRHLFATRCIESGVDIPRSAAGWATRMVVPSR
jgi:integrase